MKKLVTWASCAFAAMAIAFTSCEPKQEPNNPNPNPDPQKPQEQKMIAKTMTIDATDYAKWVYVSLKKGEVVNVTNPKEDLNWDIAFHRYDVRLNGGFSGKGKGAAVKANIKSKKKTPLKDAGNAPAEGWMADVEADVTVSFNPGGGNHASKIERQGLNEVISGKKKGGLPVGGWVDVTMVMGPAYKYSYDIYFVKLADGSVARIKLTDFFDAKIKPGYVTFSYEYPVK